MIALANSESPILKSAALIVIKLFRSKSTSGVSEINLAVSKIVKDFWLFSDACLILLVKINFLTLLSLSHLK